MRLLLTSICAAAILAAAPGAAVSAPAKPSLEQRVAADRKRAEKLAAAGKWDQALARLREAKQDVSQAAASRLRRTARRPADPKYRKEEKALRDWWAKQQQLVRAGKADPAKSVEAYRRRREALARKYPAQDPSSESAVRKRAAARARFDLLRASLDDALAAVYAKKGDRAASQKARREALRSRLQAYPRIGKKELAAGAAEKIIALSPDDPLAHEMAGEFFQEQGQFGKAAGIWEKAIRVIESGRAPRLTLGGAPEPPSYRNRQLARLYRQLAFCCSRLGRNAETARALEKAKQAESQAQAQLRRR